MTRFQWRSWRGRIGTRWGRLRDKRGRSYERWVRQYDTLTASDLDAIRRHIDAFPRRPLISVLMPTYNTPEDLLRRAIASVQAQLYPHWELCIADDASSEPGVHKLLEEFQALDRRVNVTFRRENGHISAASNTALESVTGEFVALLDHDDELTPHALYLVAHEILQFPDVDLVYSDEDKIDLQQRRYDPHFKSGWNPDLLLAQNYLSHLGVYRATLLREFGFRTGYEGAQDHDLALRLAQRTTPDRIRHIPHVLYHWRAIPASTAAAGRNPKPYALEASRQAVREALERAGTPGKVEEVPAIPLYHRVRFGVRGSPRLSIVLACVHSGRFLEEAIRAVVEQTDWPDWELLVTLGGSRLVVPPGGDDRVKVLHSGGPPRLGALCNVAVEHANGDVFVLLHDDVVVQRADWPLELVSQALRTDAGAVGGKLLYPDGYIQSGATVLGGPRLALNAFQFRRANGTFPMGRPCVVSSFSVLSSALLSFSRRAFEAGGGFGEFQSIRGAEIDFCLRLLAAGYRNLYTPNCSATHFAVEEGGPDECRAWNRERPALQERWGELIANDPAYNPNLSVESNPFGLAFPPRVERPWRARA